MKRILGIDFGQKRVGLAISDALGLTANPLSVFERKSSIEDMRYIQNIVESQQVSKIVIGLPLNMDGTPGMLTGEVENFAKKLAENLKIPVEFIDERLTTMQAERMLVEEADMSREKRKKVRDKIAASMILRTYLELHP